MEPTHFISNMTAGLTRNSQSKMWRCVTEDNQRVNVFSHSDPAKNTYLLFEEAGYTEMEAMADQEQMNWKNDPIGVVLAKTADGKWWDIKEVARRPDGALPDPMWVPDLNWYRNKAICEAQILLSEEGRFIDTETTGFGPDAEIIQLAILDSDFNPEIDTFIFPRNLTAVQDTYSIHEISPDALAGMPTFPAIWRQVELSLYLKMWVGYNIEFDARMIEQNAMMHSLTPTCPAGLHDAMKIYSQYAGLWDKATQRWQNVKLKEASEALHLGIEDYHSAMDDAVTLLKLIEKIAHINL